MGAINRPDIYGMGVAGEKKNGDKVHFKKFWPTSSFLGEDVQGLRRSPVNFNQMKTNHPKSTTKEIPRGIKR